MRHSDIDILVSGRDEAAQAAREVFGELPSRELLAASQELREHIVAQTIRVLPTIEHRAEYLRLLQAHADRDNQATTLRRMQPCH